MNQLNHHDYYLARAAASRDLAERAGASKVAAIHAELAARYETMAAQPERKEDGTLMRAQAT